MIPYNDCMKAGKKQNFLKPELKKGKNDVVVDYYTLGHYSNKTINYVNIALYVAKLCHLLSMSLS